MKPPLVIVSGMPASGKTTLSSMLSSRLFLPLVAKDPIKESLSRVDPDGSSLGTRTFDALHAVAARHLDLGTGLVLEAAFVRGIAEPEVRPHLARASAVNVHCTLDPSTAAQRFKARAGSPDRHRCHPDVDMLQHHPIDTWSARYGRMDLGVPVLEVDTTDGYAPTVDEIVEWVEEHIGC